MAISSDTNWDIAAPSRQLLVDTVSEIATMIRSGATAPHNMSLLMDYQFTQNMTSSVITLLIILISNDFLLG